VTSLLRTFAATLALVALLVRTAIPAGWMPDLADPLGGSLTICSVDGQHRQPSHDPSKGHDDGSICPFAAAAHFAPPQGTPAIPVPFAVAFVFAHFAAPAARIHLHDPGHAPRAPPVSV
jgi:hypothetical protein